MRPARVWNAKWIGPGYDPENDLGVFAFRRRIDFKERPGELLVNVSADNRYKLYVNGEMVIFGPQRGDPRHWFFETIDIAPYLKQGENWICAVVWNFGWMAPMAQCSSGRTALLFEEAPEGYVPQRHDADPMADPDEMDDGYDPFDEDNEEEDEPLPIAMPVPEKYGMSTPRGWEVTKLAGWGFEMMHRGVGEFYIDVGPGEIIDAREIPWGFLVGKESAPNTPTPRHLNTPAANTWLQPHVICRAEERGFGGGGTQWMLIPRSIPPMLYQIREASPAVRADYEPSAEPPERHLPAGEQTAPALEERWDLPPLIPGTPSPSPDGVGAGGGEKALGTSFPLQLAGGQPVLLDFGELICAYPRLTLSGPPGTVVTLTYDESLWNPDGTKGNRDDVASKHLRGYQDKFILDGETRTFEPLWWRTWRYLLIEAESSTGNADLRSAEGGTESPQSEILLQNIDVFETGYPLDVVSSFDADDASAGPIWDVAVRTAKRCAGETYFDCPYYEQLQYVGDTRIQALIGYYLGRDRALQRNACETLAWSMMSNGLTQSRYPARQTQVIPPFSLWWIMMLYDQVLYDTHRTLGTRAFSLCSDVIEGFQRASVDQLYWHFTDWVPEWHAGVAPGTGYTCNHLLAEMARIAKIWKISKAIFSIPDEMEIESGEYEDDRDELHMFREGLERDAEFEDGLVRHMADFEWSPSEHNEAMFRLYQQMIGVEPSPWPYAALERANAAKCTYYFSYYKHLAMRPDDYLAQLGPWKEMIESGLTTFAENPEPTRSDCHAWSAHPILGFFQIVAGVTSVAPAWRMARIEPRPGSLRRFDANIAHPSGPLRVRYEDGKLTIDTPVHTELIWRGKEDVLKPGRHEL